MHPKKLELGQGIAWYGCGWNLFRQYIAAWLLMGVIFLAIGFVCFLIPFFGPLLFLLISPVLAAGFYIGADNVNRGSSLELGMLFWGFTHQDIRTPLLILGGVLLGLTLIGSIITMAVAGPGLMGLGPPEGAGSGPVQMPGPAAGFGFVVGLLIQVLIAMCMFFAIPLAIFDDQAPLNALRDGFLAAVRNILPFLLFMIIYIVLAFIASIPFFLGLIVLFPIAFCAAYCAYSGVFK